MKRLLSGLVFSACVMSALQAQPGPRIAPLAETRWSEELVPVAAELEPVGIPNLVATYANYPQLAQALLPHLRYIWMASSLPPRDRALLGLRTAWLTRSEYLWAHRAMRAREEGFTDADLVRVARGADAEGWSAFEATLLRAADELYVDSFISDATWAVLEQRYDLPQLIDTIDTVGALTMNAGAVNSIRVELEPGIDEPLPSVPYAVTAERTNRRLVDDAPRIPPTPPENGRGISANVFSTFVHNPPADRVRGAINTHVTGRALLDPRQREFLLVRIGILCRSEYEYAAHVRSGFRVGMTEQDLALILAGPEQAPAASDPLDVALLSATDELYRDDRVAAATWRTLAESLTTEQLFDVLIAVGGYRSTSMLINSAGVQLDDNMADYRFPPELR